jgi:hypothetical protein
MKLNFFTEANKGNEGLRKRAHLNLWHRNMAADSCGAAIDISPRREPWVRVADGKSSGGAAEDYARFLFLWLLRSLSDLKTFPRLAPWANLNHRSATKRRAQILRDAPRARRILRCLLFVPLILLLASAANWKSKARAGRPKDKDQMSDLRLPASDFPLLVAPPIGFALHFTYSQWPLMNCALESSTDLVHWETRADFSVQTNVDGTISWRLERAPLKPCEFFRIAGETIP